MVIQFTRKGLFEELIDTGEKGGEGLTGAGRRSNQNISPRSNGRPSLLLHICWDTDRRPKPFGDEGMELGKRHTPEMLACRAQQAPLGDSLPENHLSIPKTYFLRDRTDENIYRSCGA